VGIEVSPKTVSVMISSKFGGGSLKALTRVIDISKITETTTLNSALILPEGARLADESQTEAKVKVTVAKTEGKLETE
jgi:YbbR domain-containing protein